MLDQRDIIIEFKEGTENIYERKNALREFLSKHFQLEVDLCREKYLKPYVRDYLKNEIIYISWIQVVSATFAGLRKE